MKLTRRDFLQGSILGGGYLLLAPLPSPAEIIKRREWQPGYAKLKHSVGGQKEPRKSLPFPPLYGEREESRRLASEGKKKN
jgi:hypothetical protein